MCPILCSVGYFPHIIYNISANELFQVKCHQCARPYIPFKCFTRPENVCLEVYYSLHSLIERFGDPVYVFGHHAVHARSD